eukprot:CAMPEP_0185847570 /NCGR_PEP_ID=MMETSP1354-20130828/2799_1 /TAXON_ID=708628 /ORGANISM="Erythrolobus madagascarensis, Strain CCMP3276" /LENGTH=245 /DNA_ID=CAMNT_0028547881 /DNA_START=73 /DNA_END=806 /DNA_ORIENTATION=-
MSTFSSSQTQTIIILLLLLHLSCAPHATLAHESQQQQQHQQNPSCDATARAELAHVVVIGSINVDLTVHVARPPHLEETVTATTPQISIAVGGKGANQAVAAARLVQNNSRVVKFVCQFGGDTHAQWLEAELIANNVDVSLSGHHADLPSGTGFVMLSPDGAASSVVVSGANSAWPSDDVELASLMQTAVQNAAVVLLQREVPERVNLAAAAAANQASVPVMLDTGGVDAPLPSELIESVDFVCP